ncbi:unnamed protein product [Rotaria magnacalcarata]|uniref:Integrase catalytic domain-containing protein n=3 Tax=Rotaria magnacalcarata TaxID=392030 RepID=A0A820F9L5_9BILA|nr:unnamed protein product [Rotaria magnacalcarata]
MLSRTCNWDQTEKNKFNNNTIENFRHLPENVTVVNRDEKREESLLYALGQGLCNLESPVREFRANEVDELRMKLYNELDKKHAEYNYTKPKEFPTYQIPGRPLTLIFIQACANLNDLDVIMYFGLDTPIVFKSKQGNKNHRNIIIQSIGNQYFNLLKIIDDKTNTHIQMAVNSTFKPLTTIDQIIAERDDPAQDIVDPLVYLTLANTDLSPTYVDTKMHNIENIKQNPKKSSFYEIPKRKPIKAETVPILEHAKAYDQEMDGQFREVHPESYGNWYSRCCKHPYTTDCFVPLVCGDLRFCGNLDTGSTCSVLSLDVAEKLFKANKLKKLYDTQINLVCAGGLSRTVNTRIVTADVSIGTARLCGVKFILLPEDMMFSCAIIGNEVLSLKGFQLDFHSRVVQYNETVMVELARLRHPRFYTHRHLPPVVDHEVLPITPEPYIQLEPGSTVEMINEIFYKINQEAEYIPPISLEYFLSEIDLLALQQGNKELRRIRKIMSYPNFKFPPELAHYNKIKNNLLIEDDIVYYKKEPYYQVPLLPTNCIITMALRIHDKYSHCGRDKLVDWVRTIAYHVKLSELLGRICSTCPTCLLKKSHPLRHTPPTIKIQTSYPFEMVVGDLVSMPQQGRYKYIFTVVDHYSKFAAAWPLKDKSSQTVADALEKHILPTFIMRPKSFLSDNGKEFTGAPLRGVLEKYNIKQIHSASYHCESHGSIERFNRTAQQLLRLNAEETLDWPSVLQHTINCYNHSRHESLKTSPSEFLMTKSHDTHKKLALTAKDIQYWRVGNPSFKSYTVGTLVMKIIPKVGNRDRYKLQNLYVGPYTVLQIHKGGTSYRIRSIDDRSIISNVHHTQLRLWASPDKTLLKNPDFFEYYNYYRPMTPIELHRYSEECDPVEERTFSRNWRPSDEPCEIDAEDLSDEFNDDQEVQNPDHESNSDHESESESDEEGTSGGYKMPDPTQIIFLPPPQTYSQMPKIPSLGEPSNTHTPWSHRNMSSPYVNNYNNGDSASPNLNNNDRLIHPPPSFTPSMDQHQFSPIQPIPHVYTPTPSCKTPQRDVYTPETNNTPPCVPKPIFTPQKSPTPIQRVPTPSKAPPIVDKNYNYTHNLEELDKSPKLHSPSPQQYFNNNYDYNQNNQDNNRDCNTPPYPKNYYQTLLNDGSPFKSTSSPHSHHQPGQQTTRGPSPDQVNEQEPKLISSGENEVSVPTTNPVPEDNTTSYRVPSPSRMVTRSQTRKENEK